MLRNVSKYNLLICCKQGSSTHFCHFLATAFVTDVLAGSNPSAMGQKRKVPIAGSLSNQWWAMRDVRVRLAPPAPRFVAPLLARCAGKRFAFPQLCTLSGSNPMKWAQTKTVPLRGPFPNQWWAMRDVACGWRRPLSLRAYGPRVLRWKTLCVSSAPHPSGFESHEIGPNKKRSPFEDRFQISGGR